MKKFLVVTVMSFVLCFPVLIHATTVNLFVDAAPNAYGSPDFAGWKTNAYKTAIAGTFVNMENSYNPANRSTTNFEINDCVVYSFGDLGKRLHFVYWVPNETIASLTAKNFEVSGSYLWDGVEYDYFDGWYTPTSWEEKDGGVIGTAGFAWWGAYGINTQEALDAELADWDLYQGNFTFRAKFDGGSASITAYHPAVPEPTTMLLLGLGLAGLAGAKKKFQI
jgi:hypothetical protein